MAESSSDHEHTSVATHSPLPLVSTLGASPISSLPNELLYTIFQWFMLIENHPQLLSVALTLHRVCNQWNDLVMSDGSLWTRIIFQEDDKRIVDDSDSIIEVLIAVLLESRGYPLTIEAEGPIHPVCLRLLFERVRWWRDVRLVFDEPRSLLLFFSLKYPRLESLSVIVEIPEGYGSESDDMSDLSDDEDDEFNPNDIDIYVESAPKLKRVAIGYRMPKDERRADLVSLGVTSRLYFPWAQLTRLEIDAGSGVYPYHSEGPGHELWSSEEDRLPFPNLTYLHVVDNPDLVKKIHAPRLSHVVLTMGHCGVGGYYNVTSLIGSSECSVQKLEFRVPGVGPQLLHECVQEILASTPKLHELSFSVAHVYSLYQIDWKALGDLPALRNIQHFTLRITEYVSCDDVLPIQHVEMTEALGAQLYDTFRRTSGAAFVLMIQDQLPALTKFTMDIGVGHVVDMDRLVSRSSTVLRAYSSHHEWRY
ncbi:hypothetical protein PM082_014968 [Marasmius tenuissimus]|nr:hypothetical protein PM082_014968 [Marasmius tenuissimus]